MEIATMTESVGLSPAALEHVLGTGDLSKLTVRQRVEYYGYVCRTVGVNAATRPFRFLTFQGQTVLYATRDCCDQLRNSRKISVVIADKVLEGDVFVVTARATTADGRTDEDIGAVPIGKLSGEARANCLMKAMTKAKRRVTLSICGLGFMDESEAETIIGGTSYDAVDEAPPVAAIRGGHEAAAPVEAARQDVDEWLGKVRDWLNASTRPEHVQSVRDQHRVAAALAQAPAGHPVLVKLTAMLAEAEARVTPKPAAVEEPAGGPVEGDGWPGQTTPV